MERTRKVEPKRQKNCSGFISPFPLLIVPFLGGGKKETIAAILLCYIPLGTFFFGDRKAVVGSAAHQAQSWLSEDAVSLPQG